MKKTLLAATLAAAFLGAGAARADEADLLRRMEKLSADLEQIKAELAATRAAQGQGVPAAPAGTGTAASDLAQAAAANTPATVFSAYGELNYNYPVRNAGQAQLDVRRAVIGLTHRFDDKTKVVSEFEWEHAVTSADDQGEAAVEQLYIEREFGYGMRARGGLFLIPAGLLNTAHEPTSYYGVERNFVETAIIPTTWREVGVSVSGDVANGLNWDVGLTSGFDLSKWDASSSEGLESPLGSIHQEGQLARARNMSVYGALNWRGMPGLLLGGSLFTGKAGQGAPGFAAPDASIALWNLHGSYTPGRWDLQALYARGHIGGIGALNQTLVGNSTLVPSAFYGWYLQAAYQLYQSGSLRLNPFLRYEQFNTAKRYSDLPAGLAVAPQPDEKVITLGASLFLTDGVVLKGDYQKFHTDRSRDRINLGVGFSF